ncbi:hypothetical protein NWP21_16295 [Anabaenopsis sp. FSS-46]|uniref:hypothetical protein n=1 Tax=Anabaenopsis sp. FSS-46 TaxID=2971766 RepID=UPI0024742781|nr:hypothetical protein [Anabaenopsis sp. FSS-46]MDH6100370.1 hypothetical protein [Anabaenopsis sp. FSS-46]
MDKKENSILLFLLINGIVVTGIAYGWKQITSLPSWYTHGSGESVNLNRDDQNVLEVKLTQWEGENNRVDISLNETELTVLMSQRLAKNPKTSQVLQSTKGIKASIQENQVTGGLVVQPSQLPHRARRMVQQVLPMAGDRPLYIGVTSSPIVQDGQISLSDNTQLSLGSVSLSLADITKVTGLSKSEINQQLNLAMSDVGLSVDSIEVVNGELVVRGTKTELTAQDINNQVDR